MAKRVKRTLISGRVGPAAEALLTLLRDSNGAIAKTILRDRNGKGTAALVIIEGNDTDLYINALEEIEEYG